MDGMDGMPTAVGLAVLGAAVMHAIWNALAKYVPHRLLASALMGVSFTVIGAIWCVFTAVPAAASWPFLVASAALQTGYLLLLTAAYSVGDFSRVYPVARGVAPVVVTVVAIGFLGERLSIPELTGVAVVAGGLGMLVSGRLDSGRPGRGAMAPAGLGLAVATGFVIASYSLVDGLGVRRSGSAAGYAAWQMLLHGPMLIVACAALAGPSALVGCVRSARYRVILAGLGGGALSLAAYATVLWAQSQASLALVSALRETSVLFAGLLGALLFAERLSWRQTVAAVGVVAGIVLMQVG